MERMRKERTQRSAAERHFTVQEFDMFQLWSGVQTIRDIFFVNTSWRNSARWKGEMVQVYRCLIKHRAIKVYSAGV
jgi:hypothetical protein